MKTEKGDDLNMKKIALLLCLIICLGVFTSCKAQKDINDDPGNCFPLEPSPINAKLTYYLSKNVFIANILECNERIDEKKDYYMDVKLEILEVFKGGYAEGETVDITFEDGEITRCLEKIYYPSDSYTYMFMLDYDDHISEPDVLTGEYVYSNNDEYLYDTELGAIRAFDVYYSETLRVFKIDEYGNIRSNYATGNNVVLDHCKGIVSKENVSGIPENIDDMLRQILSYRHLVEYLKTKLNTNALGVIDEAENIFVGEIMKTTTIGNKTIDNKIRKIEGVQLEYLKKMELYKVKVKVLHVFKGDYKAGDMVYSYVFVAEDNDEILEVHPTDEQLFIDGAGFYEDVPAA